MCFSDFVADPMTRSQCGKGFIGVFCLYATVHIIILLKDVFLKVHMLIRKVYNKCKGNRSNKYKENEKGEKNGTKAVEAKF